MIKRHFLLKYTIPCLIGCSGPASLNAIPATSTWIAESPENNMNNAANWNPAVVPTGVVQVIFDSSIANVDLNPTQSNDTFSVCSILFPNSASPFTINFNDHEVALNGLGITGTQTNTTMNATNTDNPTTLGNQFSFNRSNNSSSGSAVMNVTNTGTQLLNSSGVTLSNMDNQFFVQGPFSILNGGSLTLTNTGSDSSHGTGANQIAFMAAYQAQFNNTNNVEDNVTISLSNSGTYSGSNSLTGNNVGYVLNGQYYNADAFVAGNTLDFSVTNNGVNSGTSEGSTSVGVAGSSQINFGNTCNLGVSNVITVSNHGENSGNSGTNGSNSLNVGTVYEHQLYVNTQFVAGDDLSLTATNTGVDSGSGSGQTYVGCINTIGTDGDQVKFNNSCTVGKNAAFTAQNSGTCSGSKAGSLTNVGQLNSHQMSFNGEFQANDFLNFSITNSGTDSSHSINTSSIGTVSSSQLLFGSSALIQNNATIDVSNHGNFSGNTVNPTNYAGVIGSPQFKAVGNFESGNSFRLQIENSGEDTGSGAGRNLIGSVGAQQALFQGSCTLGNDANIVISNTGTNSNESTSNQTGYVNFSQLEVDGNFNAGNNLNISITNSATNTGNVTNNIGYVSGSQALFNGTVTLGNGSIISTTNNGTVEGTQISLSQGFTVSSGKATIQVINEGRRVSDIGFLIQGANSGGNADIILKDALLNIGTTLPTFTIASLNGDSTSIVQSRPQLIINTGASTQTVFSGVIQNYTATSSTLLKTGTGTQKLSGINTYTGLTTVQEGILVLNGSLAGGVLINPLGTLKGNGSIGGTLTNAGVVSPGESIGTLTVGNYINNNGTYDVEVNGLGQSDLIDVTGTATLNGGTVVVSSVDGTYRFQQPYTILTAGGGVTGTFTGVTSTGFINPILTYDPDNVFLTLQAALSNVAEKCNQIGVATNLDNIASPNAEQSLLINTLVNLPLEAAQQALESLSGFQYTNDVLVTEISTSRLLRRLYDPLRSLVARHDYCNEWTTWLETGYGFTNLQGNTAHKLNFNSYQITSGIQRTFGCALTFGLAGSYEHDNVTYLNGRADRNTGFTGVYGLYRPSVFYGLFNFVYGYSLNRFKRTIEVGDLQYNANSNPNSNTFTTYAEAGFDLEYEYALIQPFLGVQFGKNWRGQVNENFANGWGLAINKYDWTSTRSRLGLHLSTWNMSDSVDTSFDIAWNQLLSSTKNSAVGHFQQFGDSFCICGNRFDNYSIDYTLTFSKYFGKGLRGYLELDGEWWQHANTFNVLGGIQYSW